MDENEELLAEIEAEQSQKQFRAPQEKKRLSYAKDCRNVYGESDKGSRTSIKRHKTFPNRAYRHRIAQALNGGANGLDVENAEALDDKTRMVKRRIWKKSPDKPLGEIVKSTLEERGKTFEAKIKRRIKASYSYREK